MKSTNSKLFKVLTGVALGFLFITQAFSQNEKSLLWKIEGKGLKEPSYLYGTIHAICKDDFSISPATKTALENTKQTVLEIDMDDPTMMTRAQQSMLNPGMKNISDQFTEEQRTITNNFLKANYNADLNQFGVMKPFGILSLVMLKSIPCETFESYEGTFVKDAADRKREVLGLETIEYQMSLFDDVAMTEQIDMLVESIKSVDDDKTEFKKLVAAYKAQDLQELFTLMQDSPQFAKFQEIMLDKRNQNWIPVIEKLIAEKSSFIAVGAMHLPGEQGVITLLRKAGYKLTPVLK